MAQNSYIHAKFLRIITSLFLAFVMLFTPVFSSLPQISFAAHGGDHGSPPMGPPMMGPPMMGPPTQAPPSMGPANSAPAPKGPAPVGDKPGPTDGQPKGNPGYPKGMPAPAGGPKPDGPPPSNETQPSDPEKIAENFDRLKGLKVNEIQDLEGDELRGMVNDMGDDMFKELGGDKLRGS